MNMKKKLVGVACATALALGGVVPAFAADVTGEGSTADVKIAALVAREGTKIISVTVPSTMAIAIETNKPGNTEGVDTFKSAPSVRASVTNNAVSDTPVKIAIAQVSQGAGANSGAFLLNLVDMKLKGDMDKNIKLATSMSETPLFDYITSGTTTHIDLSVEAKADGSNPQIPTDSYTVTPVLKVAAAATVPAP